MDRASEKSRKESLPKMERVINSGSSVLIFPEGGWNNTENLPVQKLFSGVYQLAMLTGAEVVPIRCFRETGTKPIYVKAAQSMDLRQYEKTDAIERLRDILATLMFEAVENHSTPIKRADLSASARTDFMNERKSEYLKTKWTRDVWAEELIVYRDKNHPSPEIVRADFDNVKVNHNNVHLIAPIWAEREKDIRYDFLRYMQQNWNRY